MTEFPTFPPFVTCTDKMIISLDTFTYYIVAHTTSIHSFIRSVSLTSHDGYDLLQEFSRLSWLFHMISVLSYTLNKNTPTPTPTPTPTHNFYLIHSFIRSVSLIGHDGYDLLHEFSRLWMSHMA